MPYVQINIYTETQMDEEELAAIVEQALLKAGVFGFCPMGCGRTLYLDHVGRIMCDNADCPEASSVSVLLAEIETEHIVTLREKDFTVRHPLRERLNGELEKCDLHMHCVALDPSEVVPGTYRVTYDGIDQDSASLHDTGWYWEAQ
jgi:phenylpyruvate tautomerase PptA (4-oxalocrotonate tautomerase family)